MRTLVAMFALLGLASSASGQVSYIKPGTSALGSITLSICRDQDACVVSDLVVIPRHDHPVA